MKNIKILIYEKSNVIRTKMANALSSLSNVGMTMMTDDFDMVVNGADECRPDVIIMEIGQALYYKKELSELRAAHPSIKLMLHSEIVDEEFYGCARELGADVFFDFMELVAQVSDRIQAASV